MINICEVLKSNKSWKREYGRRFNKITKNFEKESLWNKRVEFYNPNDKCVVELYYADYFINMMFWRPSIKLNIPFSNDMIFDCTRITPRSVKAYLDRVYVRPMRENVGSRVLNKEMSKVIECLKTIVEEFGLLLGVSFNLYEIGKLAEEDDEFSDIINTSLPDGLQPIEVEDYAKKRLNRLMDILSNSTTGFAPILQCETGINPAQLQEFMVVVGNKPDIEGKVVPKPVNTNLMIGGLKTSSQFYTDAQSGTKALIMNKKHTGHSGYFSKKLSLLTLNIFLGEVVDCKTKKLNKFFVEDAETLSRLEGINFSMHESGKDTRYVRFDDKDLIGKTIFIRTPLTCCSKKGVCRTCYGELWRNNKSIHIGTFAATHISSRFTQNNLSAKHTLMTKSEELELPEDFFKALTIDGTRVTLNRDVADKELKKYYISIVKRNISEEDIEIDEIEDENGAVDGPLSIKEYMNMTNALSVYKFDIVDSQTGEAYHIKENRNNVAFTLSTELIKFLNRFDSSDEVINIPIGSILKEENSKDITIPLFTLEVINNELSKTLNLVKLLLENDEHLGNNTIDSSLQCMNRLLIDGGIRSQLVHAAIILKNLFRSPDDILENPNFGKKDCGAIMLTTAKALNSHPSPIVTMAFERVDEQFAKSLTYRKRSASMLDDIFRTRARGHKR